MNSTANKKKGIFVDVITIIYHIANLVFNVISIMNIFIVYKSNITHAPT